MLSKARKKKKGKPFWIGEQAWKDLNTYWQSQDFKKVSTQNKVNRSSTKGGAVHTTGQQAHLDKALKMVSIYFTFYLIIYCD